MPSDIIKLLPEAVANQIAAGEVVQRPASVVKELVENAVDAGASSIQIIIKDAGRTLIQVIDNGKGMSPTDARMAFEHHATSKISTADDLNFLHTMGFRGEALPSIAAMAQIELRTMPPGETVGSRLFIAESKFERQEPCSTPAGTNIMVKNLFFHFPARRKYLKKDSIELGHILREFEKLALVNSHIDFLISNNGVVLHQLTAGSLKDRIDALFGRSVGAQLIPFSTETSIVKISGFIGNPSHARKRNAPQFFFVNGRNMIHPYFRKAVLNCYSELIAADSQPAFFINFEIDPSTIDVNVHPQKHEIKFENEQAVWQILNAAVKHALGKANAAGALDFDPAGDIPDIPVFNPLADADMPDIRTDLSYNPFADSDESAGKDSLKSSPRFEQRSGVSSGRSFSATQTPPKDWEKLYEAFSLRRDEPSEETVEHSDSPMSDEEMRSFFTLDNRYIALPSRAGLLLIHRRRAHIRILFDRFMTQLAADALPSQRLIFPETLSLSPSQNSILSDSTDLIARLGFEISFLGDNVWAVNSVPSLPGKANPVEVLSRLVADLEDNVAVTDRALLEPAALALARSAAFDRSSEISPAETDALVASLFSCNEPSFTPDGLPIIHTIDLNEIHRLFN